MRLIAAPARVFTDVPVVVVTDSWPGNNGLIKPKPLRTQLGGRAHLLSWLRVNAAPSTACPSPPRAGPEDKGSTAPASAAPGPAILRR